MGYSSSGSTSDVINVVKHKISKELYDKFKMRAIVLDIIKVFGDALGIVTQNSPDNASLGVYLSINSLYSVL